MENQEVKDVEEAIKHLEDILYVLRSNYQYRTSYAIELLINGYRTLEKHIGFYEKNGSYKARIVELEDQVEELKNLANNKQWISPCYVAENYIAKEKVDEKIGKIKGLHANEDFKYFAIKALQELKEG